MKGILNVIVFVTLAVLPPAILIFAQVQFLPYQDELFTWLHRIAVVVDIGLLWWLWPRIATPHIMTWHTWFGTQKLKALATVGVTVFAIVFSAFFADFPDGTMGNLTPSLDSMRNTLLGRTYDLSNRVLVDTEPAPEILAAHYRATCESGKGCDESVIAVGSPFWCNHAKPLQLKRRNFRNALLGGSTLCQADLIHAEPHGADLREAHLHGASSTPEDSSNPEDLSEQFEAVINKRIGKQSDLSGAIFAGGLSRKVVASIGQGLPDEDAKRLRAYLEAHIGRPESHELPESSGAIVGAYTKEAAAQWIVEYKTAVAGGG